MAVKVQFLSGPRKGGEFLIKADVTIGRSSGDFTLKDKKVSNPHVRIGINAKNAIEVEDLGSSNGTLLNGKPLKGKATVSVGDVVQIGSSSLKFVAAGETVDIKHSAFETGSWQGVLYDQLELAAKNLSSAKESKGLTPLDEPVILKIKTGIQLGEEFGVAFGPRPFGKQVPDGLILGENVPPVAFEITQGSPWQLNPIGQPISINGKRIAGPTDLKPFDEVSVGDVTLVVCEAKDSL